MIRRKSSRGWLFVAVIVILGVLYNRDGYYKASNSADRNECSRVTKAHVQPLVRQVYERQQPMVRIFSGGRVLGTKAHSAPLKACSVIIIPQFHREEQYEVPILHGWGPDVLHTTFYSQDVRIAVSPYKLLFNESIAPISFNNVQPIVYAAPVTFFQAGEYSVSATHEWSNWDWTMQWESNDTDITFLNEKYVFSRNELNLQVNDTLPPYHPVMKPISDVVPHSINIKNSAPRPKAQCYAPGSEYDVTNGQWYRAEAFTDADIPWLSQPYHTVDEWGFTFAPDECSYNYVAPRDMYDCLKGKVIHVLADSHWRRSIKQFLSEDDFCRDIHHLCQCEDDDETKLVDARVFSDGEYITEQFPPLLFRNMHGAIKFGKGSEIWFEFTESLHHSMERWMGMLYDKKDIVHAEGDVFYSLGEARPVPDQNPADIVLVSIGPWDSAYTPTYENFASAVRKFREALYESYPTQTIIIRLSNIFCCEVPSYFWVRYTGNRNERFNEIIREVFEVPRKGFPIAGKQVHDPNTGETIIYPWSNRLFIIDPSGMGGRPEARHDYGVCRSNHPRQSHVRMENQIWYNILTANGLCSV